MEGRFKWKFAKKCQIVFYLFIYEQCLKLRVHPAPCVHGFPVGCTIFKVVHPACALFSLISSV